MHVEEINDIHELGSYRLPWSLLLPQTRNATFFQSIKHPMGDNITCMKNYVRVYEHFRKDTLQHLVRFSQMRVGHCPDLHIFLTIPVGRRSFRSPCEAPAHPLR